jgi:DNA-binding CsgD family transcriptional regulator
VVRLANADLEALLDFVADTAALAPTQPYPVEVLRRVQVLVPCEDLAYQDCDVLQRRFVAYADLDGVAGDGEDDPAYWAAGPCPVTDYRVSTGDLSVVRMTDLLDRRHFHALPIYTDYFRPGGVEHLIDLGLPAGPHRHRALVLFREAGSRDFDSRDRAVLEALRPHLLQLEVTAELRRQLAGTLGRSDDWPDALHAAGLTPREREIVDLVAEGKTNAQIAAQLWVAPSTVKKHLENVYAKLGVGRRTAAATLLHQARTPVGSP